MNLHKRYRIGIYVQVLMLVRSGIHTRSSIATFSSCNWITFKDIFENLLNWGYVEVSKREGDGRDVLEVELSDKGRIFCSFVDQFSDLMGKELNSFFRYQ